MSEHGPGRRALVLLLGALGASACDAHAQTWRSVTSQRQLQGAQPVALEVHYSAGTLRLGPAESRVLYRMQVRYDEDRAEPLTQWNPDTRELRLGVSGRQRGEHHLKEGSQANIQVTRDVPLDLRVHFGAGEADLELGGLRIENLEVSTGASETDVVFAAPNPIVAERVEFNSGAAQLTVRGLGNANTERMEFNGGVGGTTLEFSGRWDRNANATIRIGLGAVTLRIPKTLGVRLSRSSFLTSFDTPGLVKRDGRFYSANWESARLRLNIDIEAGLGSVEIQWID